MALPITSFGPWGGNGANKWSFLQLGDGNGIAKIRLCVNPSIKSISFTDGQGKTSGIFGGANVDRDETVVEEVDINWPDEYLTSVSGSYGAVNNVTVITSLTFTTNQNTYGHFGTISDETFSIPTRNNVVVGFFGTCGNYVDSLSVFTTPAPLPTTSFGPFGGTDGSPFSYMTRNTIVQIVLYVGGCIHSISCTDSQGQTSGAFGDNEPKDLAGTKTQIDLKSGEYLTSISGSYAVFQDYTWTPVIMSLKFTTNLDTYGEYGTVSENKFNIPVGDNVVVGFFGKYSAYLNSLGDYLMPVTSE